jgi:ABC-2 type transport system ATP-binding protein
VNGRLDPVVEVRELRMRYGDKDVLRGLNLEIARGEVLALLGPNGAGKTTSIEIMEGFRRRSGGDVAVLRQDPERANDDWRERVGIVMQSWRDHARWQVAELVEHLAGYYTAPRDPDEVLRLVGLDEHRTQQAGKLSGGQRRRLDLALGILGRPELLFLDEPTAGFDPAARRDFHVLIDGLSADDGVTVLLTTHDLGEAERLADRIAILVRGELVACGSHEELAATVNGEAEVRWRENGEMRRERTPDPTALVRELDRRHAGDVQDLEVRRPSLEDTYLELVEREERT